MVLMDAEKVKIYKTDFINMKDRVHSYRAKYGKDPAIVYLKANGATYSYDAHEYEAAFLSFQKYLEVNGRWMEWYNTTNKFPEWVCIVKGTCTEQTPVPSDGCMRSPRWLSDNDMKQDTNYFCACNTSQQVLYELFNIRVPEKELAGHQQTSTSGTGPAELKAGIIKEANEHGFNITVEFKNFKDVGWLKVGEMVADPNVGLFFHDLYRRRWGHYEYPFAVCVANRIVKIANSLSGGYLENRTFVEHEAYMALMPQPSLGIVRKV